MPLEGKRIATTTDFFHALLCQCKDCMLTTTTLPDRSIRHYQATELGKFISDAQRLGAVTNVYFNVNPKRSDIPAGVRGGSEDVRYLCSLYADIDVLSPAHVETRLPESKEIALEYVKSLPMPPTVVVDTGYGLQAYWILDKPSFLDREADASRILSGCGRYLTQGFTEKGWKLDNVFDLARMLRFPGSYNFKLDSPVQSRILWDSGIYYALEDFAAYQDSQVAIPSEPFQADARTIGSAERIMECCAVARKLLDDPNGITEPEWHALCSNIALTPDGTEKFHQWSSLYDGYSPEETEQKIARAQAAKNPVPVPISGNGCAVTVPKVGAVSRPPSSMRCCPRKNRFRICWRLKSPPLRTFWTATPFGSWPMPRKTPRQNTPNSKCASARLESASGTLNGLCRRKPPSRNFRNLMLSPMQSCWKALI